MNNRWENYANLTINCPDYISHTNLSEKLEIIASRNYFHDN